MYYEKLPICEPVYFEGKYENDKIYDLYIQRITCRFKLKKNKIPTIQIKGNYRFVDNEYLTSSNDEIVALTLTNIDLDLFLEQYDVEELKYWCGWKFRSCKGLFTKYIDYWTNEKINAKKENNGGLYTLAKLMLNSLYGKFALNPEGYTKSPYLGEDGIVHYKKNELSLREPVYLPVGTFITAYARNKTIRTSQAIKDYSIKYYGKDLYIYSDTDSIHTLLPIEECKKFCQIDDYELGFWKHESSFNEGVFIRQKTYLEKFGEELNITCAGMPKKCVYKKEDGNLYYVDIYEKEQIFKIEDFKVGFSCLGKFTFKHLKGGVKLIDTDFTIKEEKIISNIVKLNK